MVTVTVWQWTLVISSSLILYILSPRARTVDSFFAGVSHTKEKPGFYMLTFSLVISWIFAKSITNAANLGMAFGIIGGISYAMYYLSFLVAGVVIYQMRKNLQVGSLTEFLGKKFGRGAVILFALIITIRLLNEVWSNTMVIGTYFGEKGSLQYTAAILVFTILTLAYALKGGLRSSLFTDMIQMALFGVLLFVVLGIIVPREGSLTVFFKTGSWRMDAGLNLLFVALIQIFSYPFHDPVLTDRGFISDEKTTLKSFLAATVIGFLCILLFSFVGIHGAGLGLEGQAAVEVSRTFGVFMMLIINFIMITSAASTLDSTFSSISKLTLMDLQNPAKATVRRGRWVMLLTALGGTIPLLFSPEILSATTISGTMVLGLAPIFLLWKLPAPKISFHLAIWTGVIAGLVLVFNLFPESWLFTGGKYADLFTVNIYATVLCFAVYLFPLLITKKRETLFTKTDLTITSGTKS